MAECYVKGMFSFIKKMSNCLTKLLHNWTFPLAMSEDASYYTFLPTLGIVNISNFGCVVISHCDFILHYPVN